MRLIVSNYTRLCLSKISAKVWKKTTPASLLSHSSTQKLKSFLIQTIRTGNSTHARDSSKTQSPYFPASFNTHLLHIFFIIYYIIFFIQYLFYFSCTLLKYLVYLYSFTLTPLLFVHIHVMYVTLQFSTYSVVYMRIKCHNIVKSSCQFKFPAVVYSNVYIYGSFDRKIIKIIIDSLN